MCVIISFEMCCSAVLLFVSGGDRCYGIGLWNREIVGVASDFIHCARFEIWFRACKDDLEDFED